ncbi:MAG: 2-oxo acid dehydrogenase subunit E2 [Puniceicoccales bacterium]|jgi:pyruvate dehydrogenase E2 component (dihydrolipoamide acetyltransferase)|nr:2-oxo acid dehydrogenase subunit E2 [Puniceicoccales bacterium]
MSEIIDMPKLSDTMTVGTLVKWNAKEGDKLTFGTIVCEVETDKATMEVQHTAADGVLLKQYVPEGTQLPVGAPIYAVGKAGETAPEAPGANPTPAAPTAPAKEPAAPATPSPSIPAPQPSFIPPSFPDNQTTTPTAVSDERIKASPLAKKIAAEKGVPLSGIAGTGPGGRIVKSDVLAAEGKAPAATSPVKTAPATSPAYIGPGIQEDKLTPISTIRGVIARRLLESKTSVPHFYLEIEVDAKPLADLRESLNIKLADLPPEKGGVKFTVNDLILRASAEALRRVPVVNNSWQADGIKQNGSVHLAFGVAIEDGLVTPVIRDAHGKTLRQIALEAKELIGKARKKKLTPNEMSGSTFTVTNLGMFGIDTFYGIINMPNAAILSVGATFKKPVVNERDEIVVGYCMKIGLSVDHRVVDGADGAKFLQALKEILETPALMLV